MTGFRQIVERLQEDVPIPLTETHNRGDTTPGEGGLLLNDRIRNHIWSQKGQEMPAGEELPVWNGS